MDNGLYPISKQTLTVRIMNCHGSAVIMIGFFLIFLHTLPMSTKRDQITTNESQQVMKVTPFMAMSIQVMGKARF